MSAVPVPPDRLRASVRSRAADLALGLFALLVRLAYLRRMEPGLYFNRIADSLNYHTWAQRILSGDVPREPFFMAPLYPYTLAACYRVTGTGVHGALLFQAVIGAITAVLVAQIGGRLYGRRSGLLAGVLWAIYGPALFYGTAILGETVLVCLTAAAAWALLAAARNPRPRLAAVAGLLFGAAALARGDVLLILPLALLWALAVLRPRVGLGATVAWIAALCLGAAGPVAAVAARNLAVSGEVVLLTANGGLNFAIGWGASATGRYEYPQGFDPQGDPAGRLVAEGRSRRTLSAREVSAYWRDLGLARLRSDPAGAWRLAVAKVGLALHAYEVPQAEDYQASLASAPRWAAVGFGILLPLGLAGMVLSRDRASAALLALIPLQCLSSLVLFFVLGRYRLAMTPVLAVYAGHAVDTAADSLTTRRWRRFGLMLALILPTALLVNRAPAPEQLARDRSGAHDHRGVALAIGGDSAGAAEAHRRAIAIDAHNARAWNNLGTAEARLGRSQAAAADFAHAAQLDPGFWQARVSLGGLAEAEGRLDDAVLRYRDAAQLNPDAPRVVLRLGAALARANRASEARAVLDEARSRWPRQEAILAGLGVVRTRLGDRDGAREAYTACLAVNPASRPCHEALAHLD